MIFVLLFWGAIFLVVMRLLTWVARRHPKARNAAAFVVGLGAAVALGEVLTEVGMVAIGSVAATGVMANVVLFTLIAGGATFFASGTATLPVVVFLPFGLVATSVLLGFFNAPTRLFVAAGMIAVGGIACWLKYRTQPRASSESAA